MKRVILYSILVFGAIALLPTLLWAEDTDSLRYMELLARIKKMDTTVSFTEWRYTYAKAAMYSPYGRDYDVMKKVKEMMGAKKYKELYPILLAALENNYTDVDLHYYALIVSKQIDSTSKETQYHRWIVMGIYESITKSGDGTTPETAMQVITTAEEYFWLGMNGLNTTQQALSHSGGHALDVMSVVDEDNNSSKYYFNVDRLFSSMNKMFKSKKDKK
ncbi:MAG: DUF4919 domain-containing protein [Candidatus Kapaibacterium sp.]|nr:DUF4919 domain-containing protein [Bacteroidota bacterium]